MAYPTLGRISRFAASGGAGQCEVIPARDVWNSRNIGMLSSFVPSGPGKRGYDPVCGCYCWGYKPEPIVIQGLGTLGGLAEDLNYRICTARSEASCPACTPCTSDGGECPPCICSKPSGKLGGAYGVTLGWLVAGAAIAGGGYYAYKKGAFRR
jgi:hypothetical protein